MDRAMEMKINTAVLRIVMEDAETTTATVTTKIRTAVLRTVDVRMIRVGIHKRGMEEAV